MHWAKVSTAVSYVIGPILDSTGAEYASAVIGDLSLSKNGGTLTALASAATLTYIANGQYTLAMTTGNTDTLGTARVLCNKSTYQCPTLELMVLPATVYDALTTNATNATGGLATATGSISALAGAISTLTGAQAATAVWQDTTAGDFTVASSIGKSLYTSGAVPGAAGGLFIAGTNAATTITTALTTTFTGNLTGSVGSVTGAVGSVTGNVGGNVTGSVGSVATGGITAASIADGAIDRATFAADTGIQSIRSNTAQAGASTSITLDASASSVNDFYTNDLVILTGGTGVGQGRYITAYNGTTKVATVTAWKTNPDATTTFAVMAADAIVGATAPTASQVATAVWQDTTAGDFTVANSVGKSIMNGVSLGTGLTVARCTLTDTLTTYTGNTVQTGDAYARIGAAGAGLTSLGDTRIANLDAAVSSRSTLTQTQVTGGAYSVQSASCVLGDDRIANLDATVSSRSTFSSGGNVNVEKWAGDEAHSSETGLPIVAVGYWSDWNGAHVVGDVAVTYDVNGLWVRASDGTPVATASALATVAGYIDTEVAAIKAKTDNLPASPASTTNITAATGIVLAGVTHTGAVIPTVTTTGTATTVTTVNGLAANVITAASIATDAGTEIANAVLAAGDVDGYTLEEVLRLVASALAGKLSGAATTTVTIRAADDSKPRITATVDSDGNRTSVTLDATP